MIFLTLCLPVCSHFDVLPLMHPGSQTPWLTYTQNPRPPSSPALSLCPRPLILKCLVDICLWGPSGASGPTCPNWPPLFHVTPPKVPPAAKGFPG